MKNIIGFNEVNIMTCYDCGCIFTIDANEDVEQWNINTKDTLYVECPNCRSIYNNIIEVKVEK
jgi:antirestriction protein